MKHLPSKFPALLLTLIVGMFASSTAFGSATIIVQNNDAAGVGFNDPTPATPVGNNPGMTVGEQRLKAFEFAAGIWGATLTSGPTITIGATWSTTMTCSANSAVLGSAGAASNFRDFPGAPFPGTWYGSALANALSGSDLSPNPEITARFNANIGNTGCLESAHWYYGFDNAHGVTGIDLVTVLLHEFGHGLGFQTLTSSSTGAQGGSIAGTPNSGFPSIFDKFLFDNSTGKTWLQMTDAERVASAINANNLAWNGLQVDSDAVLLSFGKDSSGRPLMFTPNPVQSGSSVSHWDSNATPDQLMEPNISGRLSHSVTTPQDLTFSLMRDIGWCAGCPQPPPPPPPTPTPPAAANDNFAAAQTISGCSGSVMGHNFAATHETGEPLHSPDSDPGGGSVWYQWQAPSTGSVTITTAGSNYDTVLAVYTGGSVGGLTLIANNDDVDPGVITTSTVTFNATAGTVYRIAVDGWGNDRGNIVLNWSESCSAAPPTVQFAAPGYNVGEGGAFVDVTVTRSSSVGASTVDYATNDLVGVPATDLQPANCGAASNGSASGKCDYVTTGGTLRFADTESSKVIRLSIVDDAFVEGNETLTIGLSNPTGATLGSPSSTTITILDNDSDPNASNPYLNNPFFVRQQYLDFLLREPDATGYNGWLTILNNCNPGQGGLGSPANCDRVEVSSSFFRSPEFNDKGYWIYRFYEGSLGRKPLFAEFTSEMRRLSGLATDAELEAPRVDFVARFMQRPEFTNIYSGLTNPGSAAQFIATLEQKARVTLPASTTTLPGQPRQYGRQELIDAMKNGTLTPAQTLRAFIEQKVVWDKHFFPAFVAMQYFGYLRRDPEDAGYNDWVDVLTNGRPSAGVGPGDYHHLIFGFVYSVEYRSRFGQP